MIDLNKIVNDTLSEMENEKFVEKVVKETLEKSIKSIVDDIFRSYSDFGKNLQKYIESNLNINFERLGLEGYNGIVLAAVKEQLDKTITIQGVEKIKESMNNILSDVKEEYTLSEIIEEVKGDDPCKEPYEYDYDEHVYLIIEKKSSGYTYIYIHNDDDEPYSQYDYNYHIDIDKEGKPYSIKFKGDEINTKKIMGGLWGLDKLLFKIYSSGAKIVLDRGDDPDRYDLYYNQED